MKVGDIKQCETCGSDFALKEARHTRPIQRFCSLNCVKNSGQFDGSQANEKHYEWKGEDANYSSKHHWIRKILGKPSTCQNCGRQNRPGSDGRSTIQWANVDHKYSREPKDYIPLCPSCHQYYDQRLRQHS